MGTVYAGSGTVQEKPTWGLPVLNPSWIHIEKWVLDIYDMLYINIPKMIAK